ncbi:hypothetical protein GCM10023204_47750 [Actinomycetospora succinea]
MRHWWTRRARAESSTDPLEGPHRPEDADDLDPQPAQDLCGTRSRGPAPRRRPPPEARLLREQRPQRSPWRTDSEERPD